MLVIQDILLVDRRMGDGPHWLVPTRVGLSIDAPGLTAALIENRRLQAAGRPPPHDRTDRAIVARSWPRRQGVPAVTLSPQETGGRARTAGGAPHDQRQAGLAGAPRSLPFRASTPPSSGTPSPRGWGARPGRRPPPGSAACGAATVVTR